MADNLSLAVDLREQTNKNGVRRLRKAERIPAVVYGAGRDPATISISHHDVTRAMLSPSFFSQIIDLKLGDDTQQVLIRDLQRHPSSNRVMHIDFYRIREDQAVQINVPIRYENEDRCKGVRLSGGIIARNLIEVEVSCLPRDLPEYIAIDLEDLDLNESIHLSDLTLPEGVSLVNLVQGDPDRDIQVVSVTTLRIEEEEVETDEEGFEDELTEGEDEETAEEEDASDTEE